MKTFLLTVCALMAVAFVAVAEPCQKERTLIGTNATIRDGSGRVAGSAHTSGSGTTFRNGNGGITGTASFSSSGSQTLRDGSGKIPGPPPFPEAA